MLYYFHRHSMHFGQFDVGFVPGVLPLPLPCSRFCSSYSPCHALPYPNTRFTRRRNKTRNGEKTREIRSLSTSTNTQCHAHAHTHDTHTLTHMAHTLTCSLHLSHPRLSMHFWQNSRQRKHQRSTATPSRPTCPPIPLELRFCPLWCSVVQCAYCRR